MEKTKRVATSPLQRLVKLHLTESEIETLKGILQRLDATCDDRDIDYINFGTINKKFRKAIGIKDAT